MTMMIKMGTVVENNNGNLVVKVGRQEACGSCAIKDSCGQKEDTFINVQSSEDISKGDRVLVQSDSSDITKYSIYVYILPVVMMVVGAIIPNVFMKNASMDINTLTLLFVGAFLLVSLMIVKALDGRIKDQNVVKVRKV